MTTAPAAVSGLSIRNMFRRAIRAYEREKFDKAAALCGETLAADPAHFDALHLLGVVKSRLGRLEEALTIFDQALMLRPGSAAVFNNRGSALVELGRYDEALISYDLALSRQADFADAHKNRGSVLMIMERYEDALTSYGQALVLMPDDPDYMNNMGRALTKLLRYDDALACFNDAIEERADFTDAILNRGKVLEELRCFDEAVVCYAQAIEAGADQTDALIRRAGALVAAERYQEALFDYDRATRFSPDRHDILLSRSNALAHLGRVDEALAGFERARDLGVDPRAFFLSRCLMHNNLRRFDAALTDSEELIRRWPNDAEILNARGLVLMNLEQFDEAMACFAKALELRPNYPPVEWNYGYLCLLHGRFVEGFRHYEGRRRQEGIRWTRLGGPEWRGEPLEGKRILLYAEQAFGDTIQFSRYVDVIARMGATVILGVYAPLVALLRGVSGAAEIIRQGEHTPPYDYHAPLFSVPHILAHEEEDIPGQPYIQADASRIAHWATRLPDAPLKVGIAWQGSQSIPGRAIPLADFAPLAAIPGVRLVSLQKTDGLEQLADLPADIRIATLGPDFDAGPDAFLDTAAVMMNLDLVISCDTAIAHLAGALGRPLWVVLKPVPDWRWRLDRAETPWYPTARLFRRRPHEDWSDTMKIVAAQLAKVAAANQNLVNVKLKMSHRGE